MLHGSTFTLYGTVGSGFDEEGFTAKMVRDALDRHGPGPITVNLNSGGGLAFEGLAIYNALKAHDGQVTIYIDAIAASAASLVAMAGDEIVMREGAMMMIHDPRAVTVGTARDHKHSAQTLDAFAEQFAKIYASRTGRPESEIRGLMEAEAWFDAETAVEFGLADRTDAEAAVPVAAFAYGLYRNLPPHLSKAITMQTIEMQAPASAPDTPKPWLKKFYAHAESAEGVSLAKINEIANASGSLAEAQASLVSAIADAEPQPAVRPARLEQTFDNAAFLAGAISDALYAKATGRAPEGPAREWASKTMLDMTAALAAANGENVRGWDKNRLADRAMMRGPGYHSTSDFPNLLVATGNRILLDGYKAAGTPLKQLARRRSAADFRALHALRLGEAPRLLEVEEGGEVTSGTRAEMVESFRVKTYARQFALSRQGIVNDDLSAFSDFAIAWGRAAAETEADLLAALIAGDGPILSDTINLYATARGNKATSGGAISRETMAAARQAMREMKGLDGTTPISVTPRHLVVGAAKEEEAYQLVSPIAPVEAAEVNSFAGALLLHVDPRLSGNSWRVFADPTEQPVIEIAYLNGIEGPQLSTREGWDTLGVEFRAVLDFGCGVTEWRGTYMNPGN